MYSAIVTVIVIDLYSAIVTVIVIDIYSAIVIVIEILLQFKMNLNQSNSSPTFYSI